MKKFDYATLTQQLEEVLNQRGTLPWVDWVENFLKVLAEQGEIIAHSDLPPEEMLACLTDLQTCVTNLLDAADEHLGRIKAIPTN